MYYTDVPVLTFKNQTQAGRKQQHPWLPSLTAGSCLKVVAEQGTEPAFVRSLFHLINLCWWPWTRH